MQPQLPDPPLIDWSSLELPDAWPDRFRFYHPLDLIRVAALIFGTRRPVELPADLRFSTPPPPYLLQEFHNIPNGNYSRNLVSGYAKGFDIAMLGTMKPLRSQIAESLLPSKVVLDVGCGSGGLARTLLDSGVDEVWGLDPSPYLLKIAAEKKPHGKFIQGLAEKTGFSDQRFDGIGACYLFHELPSDIADQCLTEFYRILRPGGRLVIGEPSPLQIFEYNPIKLFRYGGLRAYYFKMLARFVYEPYVLDWHKNDIKSWLHEHGFELISDESSIPHRVIAAVKCS